MLQLQRGGNKPKPVDPHTEFMFERQEHYQNHPCSDPDPAEIARLEQEKEAAQTDEEEQRLEEALSRARQPVCAPYGAPPARRRLV